MSRSAAAWPPSCRAGFAAVAMLAGLSSLWSPTAAGAQEGGTEADGEPAASSPPAADRLSKRHADWLAEVSVLMTAEERDLFFQLTREYQREAFIRKFWQVRDPVPKTGRNEMRERWEERAAYARSNYGGLKDARSQVLLIHGEPHRIVQVRCTTTRIPAEVWVYQGSDRVRFNFLLLFVRARGLGEARVWAPGRGDIRGVVEGAKACINGHLLEDVIDQMRSLGREYGSQLARVLAKPRPRNEEWVAAFAAASTDLPPGASLFTADTAYDFLGRFQSRTVVEGQVRIDPAAVSVGEFAGYRSRDFVLVGEVIRDRELFESFRYKFGFPAPAGEQDAAGGPLLLPFQRYLRPGDYRMILRIEDVNGGQFFRGEQDVSVPRLSDLAPLPGAEPEGERLLAEAARSVGTESVDIRLLKPAGEILSGLVRFDAVVEGEGVVAVSFLLDETAVLRKAHAPFSVELDLGDFPRPRTLRVEGVGENGDVLAWDEMAINAGDHSFTVRLIEPRRGGSYVSSLRARAEVEVPEGTTLDRLEFYVNENLSSTLYQKPFIQPIQLPPSAGVSYIRAVAHLPDGNTAEDLVFINSPGDIERVDVQFVELFVSVTDRRGRPLENLELADFNVLEDGREQRVSRFERVVDLPIHVGVLIDNSASMRASLDITRRAALRFFEQAVSPRDRAAVITFNRFPQLAVRLTNDLRELGSGLAGLTAEGQTALYDSLIFSLYHLAGVTGQRAILLLTDGKDEVSRFSFEETLEYARRAGVTVYAIGLGIDEAGARRRLDRLSGQTGGQSYFVRDPELLDEIYANVQRELRSQYMLAYQSSNSRTDDGFRRIEVEVHHPGAQVKTMSGYYP
ncbi:MAG: VWA domain-containing protein [Acidobacteria bacterium]|nr:VWA domain-containing protein [Acidobacteriota bacterium]